MVVMLPAEIIYIKSMSEWMRPAYNVLSFVKLLILKVFQVVVYDSTKYQQKAGKRQKVWIDTWWTINRERQVIKNVKLITFGANTHKIVRRD